VGKPLVVEEIFPMKSSPEHVGELMHSADFVTGWITFYWGQTITELKQSATMKDAIIAEWLEFFAAHEAQVKQTGQP
jgi:hypothetical protein